MLFLVLGTKGLDFKKYFMKISLPKFNFLSRKAVYQPSRRNAVRVKSFQLLKCLRSDDTPREILANLSNLSETGLQFFSAHSIKPGCLLKMVINFPEAERQIPVTGKVAWQTRIRGSEGAYRTGVAFVSMNFEDRELIRGFVANLSSSV